MLRAIKAAGSISIVQEPDEAVDPGMPRSALQNDSSDYRMSHDEMANCLRACQRRDDYLHSTICQRMARRSMLPNKTPT